MKTLKKTTFLWLILSCLLANSPLKSQAEVLIRGRVSDHFSGEALIGANIMIEQISRGTISDETGHYELHLAPGRYILSASYMGYKISKIEIILASQSRQVDFALSSQILQGQNVEITASRAKERETPVVFTNISHGEITGSYWSQEIPMLLEEIPGVYAYSDAGNGIGYSYLKIRGFDQKRVSVMLNGIPLNDPEDHQVYWVNMPDFLGSVQDIQIQRGVGSSIYGSSSFGGTVNILTHELNSPKKILVTTGGGSYNTRKFSLNLHSGLINHSYAIAARFSKVQSDGYRENAAVDLWSYFLSAARYGLRTTTKLNVYGGAEVTHAAWEASAESDLAGNHRHNPIQYKNAIDNFQQPHYELLHEWKISPNLTFANTLFYIHGKGYYESFKSGKKLTDFGFEPFYLADSTFIKRTDLVRQKWVEKNHLGWISRLDWEHKNGTLTFGGDFYTFSSNHWGNVLWAANLPVNAAPQHTYYRYTGDKNVGSVFLHELYRLSPKLSLMLDCNVQFQNYQFRQKEEALFQGENRNTYETSNIFVNPKFGLNYNLNKELNIFGNVSMAHREPTDDDLFNIWQGPDDLGVQPLFENSETVYKSSGEIDYIHWKNPLVKPEKLIDYEIGAGYGNNWIQAKGNFYWMDFRNEIVPYSQVNKDGFPIKGNAEHTVHRGVEGTLRGRVGFGFTISGNFSVSENYFAQFKQFEEMYDEDWNFLGTRTEDFNGKTIAGFPGLMLGGKLAYQLGPVSCAVRIQHVGKQYLDNTENETRTISAFSLIHLSFSYQFEPVFGLPDFRCNLFINNLLNKKYETAGYYDSWAGENYFWPGAGRNFFINLETSL